MSRLQQGAPWYDVAKQVTDRLFPRRQNLSHGSQRRTMAEMVLVNHLTEVALSRFKWMGLPDSASELWIETQLIQRGQALVSRDPKHGTIMALSSSTVGPANYQNEYRAARGIGTGYSQTFRLLKSPVEVGGIPIMTDPDAVLIYNNATRTPIMHIIQLYAERLAELDTTIDINAMNTRRNKVIAAGKDQEVAAANIMQQIAEGEPIIQVRNPEFLATSLTTIDLSVHPDLVDRLHILRGRIYNEFMQLIGVDNTNQDKKERMITDELGGNDDQVARVRSSALNQRRIAAKNISKLIGKPVTVDYWVEDDPSNDPMEERQVAGTEERANAPHQEEVTA